jgi:hypothetical protein
MENAITWTPTQLMCNSRNSKDDQDAEITMEKKNGSWSSK